MFGWWFSWFFRIANVYQCFFTLNILFDEVDSELEHEKTRFVSYQLYHFFLKTVTEDLT